MTEKRVKRKLSAILSADVAGYSRLMGEDEVSTVRTLEAYRKVMADLIEQFRGRVVDSPGDNLLAEFSSVVDAVQCAVEIHEVIRAKNEELPEDRRMLFRIGVNLGDVIEEGDRIYGDGVNIAARLEGLAEPGGVCISGSAHEQIENKLALGYKYLGEHTVKNIAKPVKVYKVPMGLKAVTPREEKEKKTKLKNWQWTAFGAAGAIILIIGALAIWNFYPRGPSIELASIGPEQSPAAVDVEEAKKSIAVLPFADLSPEKDQEYFVDGLSEEILNSLAQIPDLLVTARTSSFSFKGKDKTVQEIASVLGVENVLEGSVRKAGNALRITVQLVRAKDGFHLWSKTYDRELKDIFAVQEDIATAVADELKVTLSIGKSFKQLGGTDNPNAYELYLIAKGQYNKFNEELALESLDLAIELDPEFALAWASKSIIHTALSITGPANRAATEQNQAIHAAQKAIEFESNMPAGYYALGYAKSIGGDFIGARLAYNNALELTSKPLSFILPVVPIHYIVVGYFEMANELLEEMLITDPLNYASRGWYIWSFIFLGDTQRALEESEYIKVLYEGQQGDFFIQYVHLWTGNIVTRDEIDSYDTIWGSPDLIFKTAVEHLDSPKEAIENLRGIYADKKYLSATRLLDIAWWSAYFADLEFAMEAMEESIIISPDGIYALYFPLMKEFRHMPRFKKFIKEIGLVDYWNEFGWPDICRPLDNGDFECN